MYTWENHELRLLNKIGFVFSHEQIVLDVGCGGGAEERKSGVTSSLIAKQVGKVIGIDIESSLNWKKLLAVNKNLEFRIADACKLPFDDDTFDVVFTKDVLHHIKTPEIALLEMRRVCKKGGTIIIVESNRFNPIKYIFTTIILGHEHFSRNKFMKLTSSEEWTVNYSSFEDHYIPVKTNMMKRMLFLIDDVIEKIPLFKYFLGYNVAIAVKN